MNARIAHPPSLRRVLFQIHLWVGLILCIPLAIIGVTGSILVFEHELDELLNPVPKRSAAAGAFRPVGDITAAAVAAAPSGFSPVLFNMPLGSDQPATVRLAAGSQRGPGGITVYVDPVTLEVLGTRGGAAGFNIVREIFLLHANLSMRGRQGREIVGWLGVAMLVLGVSGFVLWWPRHGRWRTAFGLRRNATGYRLHRDLHGAVGFWGLAVFIVVSFSGVYLSFPREVAEGIRAVLPARDLRGSAQGLRVEAPADAKPIAVDAAVALARTAAGDAPLRYVGFPRQKTQPLRVGFERYAGGAHSSPGHGAPLITVFVDPWTARVLEVRDPRDFTAGETIMAWQHAVHAGHGLGWVWKTLVFLSGLLPVLFTVTGISMWLIKRRARQPRRAPSLPVGSAEPSE